MSRVKSTLHQYYCNWIYLTMPFKLPLLVSALAVLSGVTASDGEQVPLAGGHAAPKTETSRPNIILVLTDDQDLHMDSLSYTPKIQERLIDQGTLYKRHFCTTSVCCPSRASLWTGKLAHNTNVTDLNPPYGMTAVFFFFFFFEL
jgi:hypothetical protein